MLRHFAIARRSLMRFRPDVKWMPPCFSAMSGVLCDSAKLHHQIRRLLVLLGFAAAGLGCGARRNGATSNRAFPVAQEISVPDISDFGKVNDFLYRGAQPKEEGIERLKRLGIDTIVDLRGKLRGVVENERQHAESLGMQFINLPGSGWASPTDEEIARFFSIVRDQPRRKIFTHCWLGRDRTGMFIAAYRIAFDGWTPEQAIQEMRAFHYLEFWHPNMKRYVQHFPERLAHSPQLVAFRQTPAH